MVVLVCYDVATEKGDGERRLRRVANCCKDYGQRVQNSVFECKVSPVEFEAIKHKLCDEIDAEEDSLRFYVLGKHWQSKVQIFGKCTSYNPDIDTLIV